MTGAEARASVIRSRSPVGRMDSPAKADIETRPGMPKDFQLPKDFRLIDVTARPAHRS